MNKRTSQGWWERRGGGLDEQEDKSGLVGEETED